MSVILKMEVVNKFALTLNHPISVHAVKDSDYITTTFALVYLLIVRNDGITC